MIHGSMTPCVTHVAKQSRAIRVTMGHENPNMPIHIISTYSPRNGHAAEEKKNQRNDVKELINETRKRHMIIWCPGTTGRIGRKDERENKTTQGKRTNNIIGPRTKATEIEKGNGVHLMGICQNEEMISTETRKGPTLDQKDKWEIQKQFYETKPEWRQLMRNRYTTTQASPDGQIHRQIDYIMINANYRNKARAAGANPHRNANVDQNQKHREQAMQL